MESQLKYREQRAGRERILVLFPGALGDFVCFLPALEVLTRDRSVDLLSRSEYAELVSPAVHAGSIERHEISRLFVPGAELEEALGRFFRPYDRIFSWMGSGDRNFATNLELLTGGRARLFSFRPPDSQLHISDYYLSCVAGKRPRESSGNVPLRSDALLWSRDWLKEWGFGGKKILALAPGSGAGEKNWPAQFFRGVEHWWHEAIRGKSLIIVGPVEEEWFENGLDWTDAVVARNLGLAKVAALLSLSDLYLGNDSGLTHLAAAVGVETVALFGPTDARQWRPRGERATVVSQRVECSPCAHGAMKACPHRECLAALRPEAVIGLLQRLLSHKEADLTRERSLTRG